MSQNQQIVLEKLLEQKHSERMADKSLDCYFNYFVPEQILKDFDLSFDELDSGIVDGGGDGGIDSIYFFINGELIQDDTPLIQAKRNISIDFVFIQSKNSDSFRESAIEKFNSSAIDLLNLNTNLDSLKSVYNAKLLNIKTNFKNHYLHLVSKFPTFNIIYYYSSKSVEVHPNVDRKVRQLETTINSFFPTAKFNFSFIGADELLTFARKEPSYSKFLEISDNPITTEDGGYIVLAKLKSYFEFITDENRRLLKHFFEANIRDYEGKVEVNNSIFDTLKHPSTEEFWWLNNGVTITASQATLTGKRLLIEDPQIVNGLQTSHEIYNFYFDNPSIDDSRRLLIRVIKPSNEEERLKIIRATNSQTRIPYASLRATDLIHRDIEDFLSSHNIFYERRRNFYKNQGKAYDNIISIPFLAQIITAIVLFEPDFSRARPTTLLKENDDYLRIFNDNYPIEIYLKAIKIFKRIEKVLKTDYPELTSTKLGDIKFHVCMYFVLSELKSTSPRITEIITINPDSIDTEEIKNYINEVIVVYESLGGTNKVAKSKEFVKELFILISDNINKSAVYSGLIDPSIS